MRFGNTLQEENSMTIEELKQWAVANGKVDLVAELVLAGHDLESSLRLVYDMKTLSKEEFRKKYI